MTVLKWAHVYGVLYVTEHDDLETALHAAIAASDDGDESLDSIETFGAGGRVIPRSEVWELAQAIQDAEIAARPSYPSHWVELRTADGKEWGRHESANSEQEATAMAADLAGVYGAERVRIAPVPGRRVHE